MSEFKFVAHVSLFRQTTGDSIEEADGDAIVEVVDSPGESYTICFSPTGTSRHVHLTFRRSDLLRALHEWDES